jgi:hypothetical protein
MEKVKERLSMYALGCGHSLVFSTFVRYLLGDIDGPHYESRRIARAHLTILVSSVNFKNALEGVKEKGRLQYL